MGILVRISIETSLLLNNYFWISLSNIDLFTKIYKLFSFSFTYFVVLKISFTSILHFL